MKKQLRILSRILQLASRVWKILDTRSHRFELNHLALGSSTNRSLTLETGLRNAVGAVKAFETVEASSSSVVMHHTRRTFNHKNK